MSAREQVAGTRDDSGGRGQRQETSLSSGRVGLIALLGVIVMLFAAFTSAYLERVVQAGLPRPLAPALWFSTAVLLLSSIVVARARSAARRGEWTKARRALGMTACSGLLFATSQFAAWQQLAIQGVYLQSNPHSSFFYLLTLMHILHLTGGVIWLLVARARLQSLRPILRLVSSRSGTEAAGEPASAKPADTPSKEAAGAEGVALCATYWHFLGGLWVYLFVLLYVV